MADLSYYETLGMIWSAYNDKIEADKIYEEEDGYKYSILKYYYTYYNENATTKCDYENMSSGIASYDMKDLLRYSKKYHFNGEINTCNFNGKKLFYSEKD